MPFIKCSSCKRKIYTRRLSLRDKDFPFVSCPRCSHRFVPKYLEKRATKEYVPPRKIQVLFCGLPSGIVGTLLIILGYLINNIFISLLGGLLFSFWILLIAMALSLWKEIITNSKIEYSLICKAYKDAEQS